MGKYRTQITAFRVDSLLQRLKQRVAQIPPIDSDLSHRTLRITELLKELRGYLLTTVRAWSHFVGPHGDINYFLDHAAQGAGKSMENIRDNFAELASLDEKLVFLTSFLTESGEIVSD
jgi:hypothetical protein